MQHGLKQCLQVLLPACSLWVGRADHKQLLMTALDLLQEDHVQNPPQYVPRFAECRHTAYLKPDTTCGWETSTLTAASGGTLQPFMTPARPSSDLVRSTCSTAQWWRSLCGEGPVP